MKQRLAILGSTGSIGAQTLDIGILYGDTLRLKGNTGVPGRTIYLLYLRRTRQGIHDGMLAAAASYDQNLHHH